MVEDGLASIVMELLDGGSLDDIVAKRGPMPWREATQAIRDAAAGLAAAHEIGLVHRDVKPANLMRTGKGMVKVVDFGLVRAMQSTSQLTQMGTILGTPDLHGPRAMDGQGGRRPQRSVLAGLHVLLSPDRQDAVRGGFRFLPWATSIATSRFPTPRKLVTDLPPAACRILAHGTEKEPDERFQTAAELIAALDELSARSDELLAYEDILETAAKPLVKPRTAGSDTSPKRKQETQPGPSRRYALAQLRQLST